MNPPDALAQRMQQQGLGTLGSNATILVGSGAEIPQLTQTSPVIFSISSTGGSGPVVIHNGGELHQPSFQIVARHRRFDAADAMAYAAWAAMGFTDLLIGDVFFLWCRQLNEPIDLGKDAVGNARSAFNVKACWRR